jgi:predicted permease
MDLFLATFQGVAVLLALGVVGFWVISRRVIPEQALASLSTLAIDVAVPCLVFANIVEHFEPAKHARWWLLPVWWAGFSAGALLLALALGRLGRAETRREFTAGLFYQNAIFVPVVILTETFGRNSDLLPELFILTLLFPALFFGTAHLFFGRGGGAVRWARILNPVTVATLLALGAALLGARSWMPRFLLTTISLVGDISAPLLMLVLGGSLYLDAKASGRIHWGETLKFVLLKNAVFPAVALGAIALARPPQTVALLLMLQAAAPPLTALPMIAEREGGDRNFVCQYMIASFAFSLATIPLAMGLLALWYP